MTSGYFKPTATENSGVNIARWNGRAAEVFIEVKCTSNARDARDALLGLAYRIDDLPVDEALCLLAKSRFTPARLIEELGLFRSVVRPDLAARVYLASIDEAGTMIGALPQDSPELRKFLRELVQREINAGGGRVSRQSVKSHVLNLLLDGRVPPTLSALQRTTKASHPTVSAALKELTEQGLHPANRKNSSTSATGQEPNWEVWKRLAEAHAAERRVMRFVDPSGMSRSIVDMAQRLKSLQDRGLAAVVTLGGVLGAKHYDPDFDITAAPRLDLSVFDTDISFVRQLDAGLVESDDKQAKAVLVVHFAQTGVRFTEISDAGRVAPPLECLADLLEIGLTSEARSFLNALSIRADFKRDGEDSS
jgi:DNA-binding transcriptional ArsR family regulator